MTDRADAHIHLFANSYQGAFTKRPGVTIDEVALYASLAKDHHVRQALIVGYEGEAWAAGNNAHLAKLVGRHDWIRPAAYVEPAKPPSLDVLEHLRQQRFVGVSLYIFGQEKVDALGRVSADVWSWLADRRWLVSVNSKGEALQAWRPILKAHPRLRVIISHLGLPPRVAEPPTADEARAAMKDVLALAAHAGARVKLSGFYALTDPGHGYPHRAAWPYVEALREAFGSERLLWASDFSPCLDWLTFPQTLDLFKVMPFFTDADRTAIEGGNLIALLEDVRE